HSTPLVSTVPGAPTAPLFPYTTLFRSKPAVKARFDEKGRSELHALRLVVFLPVLKKVIGSGVAGGGGVFETGSASEAPSAHLWALLWNCVPAPAVSRSFRLPGVPGGIR